MTPASAAPTACSTCVPVGLEPDTMLYLVMAPVRRHLAAAGCGVVLRADRREQHLERRDAELQAQRAIAIVGKEPVVAGSEREARRGEHRFVSGAADLEKDLALIFELDFLVVQLPRQEHDAVDGEQIVARQPFEKAALPFR